MGCNSAPKVSSAHNSHLYRIVVPQHRFGLILPELAPTALLMLRIVAGMTGPTPPAAALSALFLIYTFRFLSKKAPPSNLPLSSRQASKSLIQVYSLPVGPWKSAHLGFRSGVQKDFDHRVQDKKEHFELHAWVKEPELGPTPKIDLRWSRRKSPGRVAL